MNSRIEIPIQISKLILAVIFGLWIVKILYGIKEILVDIYFK